MEGQENDEQKQGIGNQMAQMGKEQLKEELVKKPIKKVRNHLLKVLMPIVIKLVVILLIVGAVGAVYYVLKDVINEAGKVFSAAIHVFVEIGDNGIVIATGQEMMDKIDEILEENDIDRELLDMGDEEQTVAYLYKFMTASLATQLPYKNESESTMLKIVDIAKKALLGPLVTDLLNNKQEVNGIVKIKRQVGNEKIDLKYKKYESFAKLIEENNEKNEDSALNYFSLDEEWMLCIAKKNKITTTQNGKVKVQNIIEEVKVPYQTIVSQYSVPFEFFIALQIASGNPEYVAAVADLIQDDGEIELTIFESKETCITTTTQKYKPVTTSKSEEESSKEEDNEETKKDNENKETTTNNKKPNLQKPNTGTQAVILTRSSTTVNKDLEKSKENKETEDTKKEEDSKEEKTIGPEETHTTITTNESTIISVKVTKADVWVIKQNANYVKNSNVEPEYPFGEDGITTELDNEEDKVDITENVKQEIIKEEWIVDSENSSIEIEKDKFLGLWRNASGSPGLDYDPDGKLVKYKLPKGLLSYESPIENILSSKELLYDQLEKGENTQTHALLMRYLIQYYLDPDSAVEPDLSIFENSGFTEVSTIYGSTIQEKLWNTLRKAGFSEYATAGAMGNIHYESNGFNTHAIEAGYNENNGGIGICQWTNINRGTQGRNTNLKNYASANGKQWTDENIQIQFLLTELTGTGDAVGYATYQLMTTTNDRYGRIWRASEWENAGDIETATKAFCYTFERPDAQAANSSMNTRISLAEQYYNTYHGKEVSKDVIRYYQNDYATVPYGSKSIATSGCGPTAFAMVATHLTGTTITPADAIKWCGNTYYVKGAGTSWSYFNAAAKHFGLPGGVKQTNSMQEVQQALQSGKLVISSQSEGLFTSGGHYILLTKMVDGKIYVNDPNKNNAIGKGYNNRAFTVEEISRAAKQYWIFK